MTPPKVRCLNKIWHPNISVDGDICLSLLRLNSIDGLGWVSRLSLYFLVLFFNFQLLVHFLKAPTRRLKDIVWGLNSLFTVRKEMLTWDRISGTS